VIRTLAIFAVALAVAAAQPASAQLPDAEDFLKDLGFNPDQISQVSGGNFVEGNIQASNERELVVALAFLVQTSPTDLVSALRKDLLDRLDPNTIAYGVIEGAPSLASFEKLSLDPDEQKRAKAYVDAPERPRGSRAPARLRPVAPRRRPPRGGAVDGDHVAAPSSAAGGSL
jgi:hypothetical protein